MIPITRNAADFAINRRSVMCFLCLLSFHIKDKSVRFLFIDGDHTRPGVEKDLELFLPKLVDGAIIAFDDFSGAFPGVVEAVRELLEKNNHGQLMSYPNTLIMRWNPVEKS